MNLETLKILVTSHIQSFQPVVQGNTLLLQAAQQYQNMGRMCQLPEAEHLGNIIEEIASAQIEAVQKGIAQLQQLAKELP
jgi:hypothetical protein